MNIGPTELIILAPLLSGVVVGVVFAARALARR